MPETKPIPPSEGLHQLCVCGERLVADVRMTLQDQWPEKREVLMAHPLSGSPRFPWPVTEFLERGGIFSPLTCAT